MVGIICHLGRQLGEFWEEVFYQAAIKKAVLFPPPPRATENFAITTVENENITLDQ